MSEKRSPGSMVKAANSLGAAFLPALLAALFTPALAHAQDTDAAGGTGMTLPSGGWYGGLTAGRSQPGIRESLLPVTGARQSQLSENASAPGYRLYGGYQFSRNITLEGGYADFGRLDAQRESVAPMLGAASNTFRFSAFYLGAVGIIPLPNRFSLFGKLGTSYGAGASSVSTGGVMPQLLTPADPIPRRTEWNSKYGLGASYEMSNKLGLRFEYERSNSLSDGRIGEGNVGMWSLGLTKRY